MEKKLNKFEPRKKVLRNKKITITTTQECAQKLCSLAKESGMSQSKIFDSLIINGEIINITQGKDIVAELHQLHFKIDEKITDKEILAAVHSSVGKIAALLNSHIENLKGDKKNGNCKNNYSKS